jgi:hypothetical protein
MKVYQIWRFRAIEVRKKIKIFKSFKLRVTVISPTNHRILQNAVVKR